MAKTLCGGHDRVVLASGLAVCLIFFTLLQGSIGFPGFPGANGEKGGRVRTVLARCAACVRVPVLALHSVPLSFSSIC